MRFIDTIKASSEDDAFRQIARLYRGADDFELLGRFNTSGESSRSGSIFKFRVTQPDYDEGEPIEIDLEEEEY